MKFIATGGFNTGRLYTDKGQRIHWSLLSRDDAGVCWLYFYDVDRMGGGWMPFKATVALAYIAGDRMPLEIMRRYDAGDFDLSHPDDHSLSYDIRDAIPDDFDFGGKLWI